MGPEPSTCQKTTGSTGLLRGAGGTCFGDHCLFPYLSHGPEEQVWDCRGNQGLAQVPVDSAGLGRARGKMLLG